MSIRSALEELLLIVEIHQKHTKNNFAWAEVEYAKELLTQPEPEQEQEPVAKITSIHTDGENLPVVITAIVLSEAVNIWDLPIKNNDLLYLAPPISCEVEKLLTQPEQTEQEAVAWKVVDKTTGDFMFSRVKPNARSYTYDEVIPLYTSPPKREPLSDDAIRAIVNQLPTEVDLDTGIEFCRIIEQHYGIGGGE